MAEKVFTFWEGKMPDYIKLCLKTWKFDYVILSYETLSKYTDLQVTDRLKQFSLPKIADVVRVHVLRDNGGYWLDADTIMITDKLPTENMIGYPETRGNTIGFLHTEPHSDMYNEWAKFQDERLEIPLYSEHSTSWDFFGNCFTDAYVKKHPEITIADVTNCWPETYMFSDERPRHIRYVDLYFNRMFGLKDFYPTNMLMLHNSWTPDWYKNLSEEYILSTHCCTLSNILKEVLN